MKAGEFEAACCANSMSLSFTSHEHPSEIIICRERKSEKRMLLRLLFCGQIRRASGKEQNWCRYIFVDIWINLSSRRASPLGTRRLYNTSVSTILSKSRHQDHHITLPLVTAYAYAGPTVEGATMQPCPNGTSKIGWGWGCLPRVVV